MAGIPDAFFFLKCGIPAVSEKCCAWKEIADVHCMDKCQLMWYASRKCAMHFFDLKMDIQGSFTVEINFGIKLKTSFYEDPNMSSWTTNWPEAYEDWSLMHSM